MHSLYKELYHREVNKEQSANFVQKKPERGRQAGTGREKHKLSHECLARGTQEANIKKKASTK